MLFSDGLNSISFYANGATRLRSHYVHAQLLPVLFLLDRWQSHRQWLLFFLYTFYHSEGSIWWSVCGKMTCFKSNSLNKKKYVDQILFHVSLLNGEQNGIALSGIWTSLGLILLLYESSWQKAFKSIFVSDCSWYFTMEFLWKTTRVKSWNLVVT